MGERRTKGDEEHDAREAAARAAERRRVDADAKARGWGGLVPGVDGTLTGVLWIGQARMAHARQVAGLPLDDVDVKAIAMYPEMPPLIDA